MKRLALVGRLVLVIACVVVMTTPSWAGFKMEIDDKTKGEVGIWLQTWYQWVEDGKKNGSEYENLNDFLIRRAYFYLKGQVTDYVSFFTHIASDKVGMEKYDGSTLDKSGLGLGSGIAWRDLWVTFNIHEAFKIQVGRNYVPLTRNYGTTSTKSLLTLDLPFLQGGYRGGIFYASKVGRDDGITLWGNPGEGLLQYRLQVSEGVEGTKNPKDRVRFAGRLSLSLFDKETGWFNKGTYLGKKNVLSFGLGFQKQNDLTLNGVEGEDNDVWTADLFFDRPVGDGAVTVEAAYVDIKNCTESQPDMYTDLKEGDDATTYYLQAGYLFPKTGPGSFQPYIRYENLDVDTKNKTDFLIGGVNYYFKGHNCKLTADYMRVSPDNPDKKDRTIFTVQAAIGF